MRAYGDIAHLLLDALPMAVGPKDLGAFTEAAHLVKGACPSDGAVGHLARP